ncbi:MAG: type I-U CRISPR-associated RAMP protein Csb1/Cas7u [Phycisphaerales bacterium]
MLQAAVSGRAVAIRCRTILQPAAGSGTKVFPPTHAGGVYATEKRRIPVKGESGAGGWAGGTREADCVLLDSVQSQANRIEDALQQAIDDGRLEMPLIVVNFGASVADVQRVTSLQAPHRAADAILRDSLTGDKDEKGKPLPFRKSEVGRAITDSSLANATGLFRYCPHALFLGVWDSTGPKGGLGAKFARALVSEIVGIDAAYGVRTGSRIDPIQTKTSAGPLYAKDVEKHGGIEWTLDPDEALKDKKTKQPILFTRGNVATGKPGDPAKANHSNIPPSFSKYAKGVEGRDPLTDGDARQGAVAAGGVTVEHAEHTAVLSLPQLRRLRFPLNGTLDKDPKKQAEIDNAARTVLAALSLVGLTLSLERGSDLRSRCLLFPEGPLSFELLETPGKPTPIALDSAGAIAVYSEAVKAAVKLGLPWETKPIPLAPSPELIALVKKSQELAAVEGGEEGE